MKAVKWFAPHDMRVVDVDMPEPKPHEALIRVESTGICGSDIHYYADGHIGKTVCTKPIILGHEYAGIVDRVGDQADASLVGKRVAVEPGIPCGICELCRSGHYNVCPDLSFPGGPPNDGAFCEFMAVHAGFCFPVPESVPADVAALIEPLAVAVHTVELGAVRPGDTVGVLGLGPIGLLTAQVAKIAGARAVFGTDLEAYRVEAAARWGVDAAFNARERDTVEEIMRLTNGRGVDVALDCARSTLTPGLVCRVARRAGRGVLTGISGEAEGVFPVDIARRKELTVTWCRRFRFNYPTAIHLAATGAVDLRSLITHSFPLERTQEGFELVCGMADGVLKVSIDQ